MREVVARREGILGPSAFDPVREIYGRGMRSIRILNKGGCSPIKYLLFVSHASGNDAISQQITKFVKCIPVFIRKGHIRSLLLNHSVES